MGDRANVLIKQRKANEYIYLYTHWDGCKLPATVVRALARKERWNDGPYLARIIFCEMIKGREADETGFGISTQLVDNRHALIGIDPDTEEISLLDEENRSVLFGPVSFEKLISDPKVESDFILAYREA